MNTLNLIKWVIFNIGEPGEFETWQKTVGVTIDRRIFLPASCEEDEKEFLNGIKYDRDFMHVETVFENDHHYFPIEFMRIVYHAFNHRFDVLEKIVEDRKLYVFTADELRKMSEQIE